MRFEQEDGLGRIRALAAENALDTLDFGVIGFDEDDAVTQYNAYESEAAGLAAENVIGKDLFVEVAPCFNNFMVAERFEEDDDLDEVIDYVLTLKMRPTKTKLRLLKSAESSERYILVQRA